MLAEHTPLPMQNNKIQFVRGLVLIPFLTTGSPLAMLQNLKVPAHNEAGKGIFVAFASDATAPAVDEEAEALRVEHIEKIDAYYKKRGMPLEGYGAKLVEEAEKNDLDWRLLPAISIQETTGGKFACHNNPFGWGSCKIKFQDWNEAIETVARNLGGNNPKTERYYKGKTTLEKLDYYNSEVDSYTKDILNYMELIDQGK